jgi:hypothetical protein
VLPPDSAEGSVSNTISHGPVTRAQFAHQRDVADRWLAGHCLKFSISCVSQTWVATRATLRLR